MTPYDRTMPAEDPEEQVEEIRSDLEKIQPEGITVGDRIKDVASTMKREDLLEPYNSAEKPENKEVKDDDQFKLYRLKGRFLNRKFAHALNNRLRVS